MKLPIEGKITSGYKVRKDPITGEEKMHYGIDISAEKGTDILSNMIGTISFAGEKGNYGNLVILKTGNVEQYFGHLDTINVKTGQKVSPGDLLGEVGSTGYSTGNHLHWEIKEHGYNVNPLEFNFFAGDNLREWWDQLWSREATSSNIMDLNFNNLKESTNKIIIYIMLGLGLFIFIALSFFPGTSKSALKGVFEK